MDNDVMERYVNFICGEVPKKLNILLYIPQSIKGEIYVPKIGPKLFVETTIEIKEKYTRSAKFILKFDKYEIEDIFFMSRHKGPEVLLLEIEKKIERLVNKTYIDDNREKEISIQYREKANKNPFKINFIK